ncbi:MAG TPA: winged helix-turn-helix domain-containing protein [Terriglobales bacterium]|nr:winged helix-turn-helix domain-containing protein [Terriglobales bacterium]
MPVSVSIPTRLCFDGFELDPTSGELHKDGRKVALAPKVFELLCALTERPGEVVTREELRAKLWTSDTFVEFDDSLNHAIKKLRQVLGDSPEDPQFIETMPRHGYRFIAPVDSPRAPAVKPAPRHWTVSKRFVLGAALLALVAALFAFDSGGWRERWFGRVSSPPIGSLAVLPFQNLSGDSSKDYFADGFTDELITNLAEQTRIRIVSRSSVMRYKGTLKPLAEIARELNVDAVVEGSVSLSDRQVRITAQLIQAPADRHLWAHSYERDRQDLFSIQRELAATIAGLIGAKTNKLDSAGARNPPRDERLTAMTYELMLECRNLRRIATDESVSHAMDCYQHILLLDPENGPAYAGLADCYNDVDPSKAAVPATKAIELQPTLVEAHVALAHFKAFYAGDLKGAEKEFRQALALNPSYARAHVEFGLLLVATGRTSEAMEEVKTARELDPFSAADATASGIVLFMAGQFDKTIEQEQAALKLDPRRERASYWLGYAYERKGMYREAITEYEKVFPSDAHGVFLAALGRAYALAGDSRGAAGVKHQIERFSGKDSVWPYDAALFYAALGDKDRAFEGLEKEQRIRGGWLLFLDVDPRLSVLRSDPRFQALLRKVNFPM